MSIFFFNHIISERTPSFGNKDIFSKVSSKSICCGDSSNNSLLSFSSHLGTHIDAPFHFCDDGKSLDNYEASFWANLKTQVVELHLDNDQLLNRKMLEKLNSEISKDIDFLILKTGFEKYRSHTFEDSPYIFHNPGVEPECADWIRENTKARFLGFDFISLSSFSSREIGREAHRKFLCDKNPILIVEDMKLELTKPGFYDVTIAPLLFEKADGSPVTIIAKKIN